MPAAYGGLKRPAFSPAAVRQSLASSPVHAEALARLDFLCESRLPLGLLLGPAGSGKSTVLAEFAERAARGGALVAMTNAATPDELAVLVPLGGGPQVAPEKDSRLLWRYIIDRFEEIKLEGLSVVILRDALDRASARVL